MAKASNLLPMTPLPWLQFDTPQLPKRPSIAETLMPLAQAGIQRVQARRGPGINPPARKFPTMGKGEIAQSAGAAANAEMGAPPPVMKRRFPNPQQQMQLDMMR